MIKYNIYSHVILDIVFYFYLEKTIFHSTLLTKINFHEFSISLRLDCQPLGKSNEQNG